MAQEQIFLLAQIYNKLMTIQTKGTDTLTMAECLTNLKKMIFEIQEEKGENLNGG